MNIYEVLEYGPICAGNEELGLLITVNGSYVNLWIRTGAGEWQNTDCRYMGGIDGLYAITAADMIDKAEAALHDWTEDDDE